MVPNIKCVKIRENLSPHFMKNAHCTTLCICVCLCLCIVYVYMYVCVYECMCMCVCKCMCIYLILILSSSLVLPCGLRSGMKLKLLCTESIWFLS